MSIPIIDPVDVELLKKELNQDTFLRKTTRGNNEIYVDVNSPDVEHKIILGVALLLISMIVL